MISKTLKELLARAETWPEAAQAELVQVAAEIEAGFREAYRPTKDELAAIDRGLADAAADRFARDEEVEAVFAKYRRS